MVSRTTKETHCLRLEKLIAYELALESSGKTIYDLPVAERAAICPAYEQGSIFWGDIDTLINKGLVQPRISRKVRASANLFGRLKELIASGKDVFSMNRAQLGRELGVWHSYLCQHATGLAEALQQEYGRTPVFARSLRDGHVERETRAAYNKLLKQSPLLPPTIIELSKYIGVVQSTLNSRCERYNFVLSHTKKKPDTIKRWRKILGLEGALAKNSQYLPNSLENKLQETFPDRPLWLIKRDLRSMQKYAQVRLYCLVRNGSGLSDEAKWLRNLLASKICTQYALGKPQQTKPA